MNKFLEQLRNLDFGDIGRWPLIVHAFFVSLCFVAASAAGFWYFVYSEKMPSLDSARAQELELRTQFETKQQKAANFSAYKEQLAEIERNFGTMLRQLPGKTEIPNLLVDISQTGLGAGLQEELFQPVEEVRREFYAEKPIKIRLRGAFHEFGRFVSDIAALPRIVTLHDIEIVPDPKDKEVNPSNLILNVTAKTYRYLEDEDDGGARKSKKPATAAAGAARPTTG